MGGFHKPTVMTVAVIVIVTLVAYHFWSKKKAAS